MDPINILFGVALVGSLAANYSGSKKGMKTKMTKVEKRPKTYLQKVPLNISALVVLCEIIGVFQIGTLGKYYGEEYYIFRLIGLGLFILFSYLQVKSYKSLGEFYSPEIVIVKEHKLITEGIYKLIRHPQYLSQIIMDIGAGIVLCSYLVLPLAIIIQMPLLLLRASYEEKLLAGKFNNEFTTYKEKSGFILPFIG
jgi:protein-S-isoprenylcysteine O-methyltransferase Ste14